MSEDRQWRGRSHSPIPRVKSPVQQHRSRSRSIDHGHRAEHSSSSQQRRIPDRPPVDPSEHLSFFNLDRNLNEEDMEREILAVVGYAPKFTLARDGKTKASKGFGFVKFESLDDAVKVKESLHEKVCV